MKVNKFSALDLVKFLGWPGYKENSENPLIVGQIYCVESIDRNYPEYVKLMGVRQTFHQDFFVEVEVE